MAGSEAVYVALLRAVNVGGKNKLPMAKLRSVLAEAGYRGVETYIQSGNLVFRSALPTDGLGVGLERLIEQHFDLSVPAVVRSAPAWKRILESNPFEKESKEDAGRVLLALSMRAPDPTALPELEKVASLGERIRQQGDAVWIHYAGGVGRSKLTTALLDRRIGSVVTARNWRTVLKLQEMAEAAAE